MLWTIKYIYHIMVNVVGVEIKLNLINKMKMNMLNMKKKNIIFGKDIWI